VNILPDSRLKAPKHEVLHKGYNWEPVFCANCGKDGGFTPRGNFLFYLCQDCAESLPPIDGTYLMPDEVFWQKFQQEKEGK